MGENDFDPEEIWKWSKLFASTLILGRRKEYFDNVTFRLDLREVAANDYVDEAVSGHFPEVGTVLIREYDIVKVLQIKSPLTSMEIAVSPDSVRRKVNELLACLTPETAAAN